MGKIPYHFNTPIPRYFEENGWLPRNNPEIYMRNILFLSWAFGKCNTERHTQYIFDREIHLEPFEFICSLREAASESGCSVRQVRTILNSLVKSKLVKKSTHSSTHQITVYIWLTENFYKTVDTLNDTQATHSRHTDPTSHNNRLELRIENKESTKEISEPRAVALPPIQKIKTPKLKNKPNTAITPEEHLKLVQEYGEPLTLECYKFLEDWKESKRRTAPKEVDKHTDFHRIRKWVVEAVKGKPSLTTTFNNKVDRRTRQTNDQPIPSPVDGLF